MIRFYMQLNQINVPKNDPEFTCKIPTFFRSRNSYENNKKKNIFYSRCFLTSFQAENVWKNSDLEKTFFLDIFIAFSRPERAKKIDGKILPGNICNSNENSTRIFPSIFIAFSGREIAMKISGKLFFSRSEFFHPFSAWKKVRKQREWKIFFFSLFSYLFPGGK